MRRRREEEEERRRGRVRCIRNVTYAMKYQIDEESEVRDAGAGAGQIQVLEYRAPEHRHKARTQSTEPGINGDCRLSHLINKLLPNYSVRQ
jgi:hypothetical protein